MPFDSLLNLLSDLNLYNTAESDKLFTNYSDLLVAFNAAGSQSERKRIFSKNKTFIQSSNATLTEIKQLFQHLNGSDQHEVLMEIIPWEKITATTDELKALIKDVPSIALSKPIKRIFNILLINTKDLQGIIELGKAYVSGDKARAEAFVSILAREEKIKTIEDWLNLLKLSSEADKKLIGYEFAFNINQFEYELSAIKEIGLVMGLAGNFYEGTRVVPANKMTKRRFKNSLQSEDNEPLPFHLVEHYKNASDFSSPIKKHGDLHGIHAEWEEHSFSFHLVKDGDQTHLIYVNRGQRHELAQNNDSAVSVFTFTDQDKIDFMISGLIKVLKTGHRDKISMFINQSLKPYTNQKLNEELWKSNQKVGNCAVANANIAWHFALVSREMKRNGCSFAQAYEKTRVAYKEMRMKDRAQAFSDLMTNKELTAFRKDAVTQIMLKMYGKDLRTPGRETKRFLLNHLHEKDPEVIKTLLQDLCQSTYDVNGFVRLEWARACINKLKEERVYNETLSRLVAQTNFLSDLSIPRLKLHLHANPSDINFVSQDSIADVISDVSIHYLSIENIHYLLNTFSSTRERFISKLSINQINTLLENQDIDFQELSAEQKENTDVIRVVPTGAINQEAFYEALSVNPDFKIINKFNQSGDTEPLPMLNRYVCAFMSYDFIQAVSEGRFEDWRKKIIAKEKQITQHVKAIQQSGKWDSLGQSDQPMQNGSVGKCSDTSLSSENLMSVPERKAISQKIADNFQGLNPEASSTSFHGVFLSAEHMQHKDSFLHESEFFEHGMMFSVATTKDGKLDPEYLLFLDPNAGILKIKNNFETIDNLITSIDAQLFSQFAVGLFRVTPISEQHLEKTTSDHRRSYALSQAALIYTYLDMRIERLERKRRDGSELGEYNQLIEGKKKLEELLTQYPHESPETREDNLMRFQQELLGQADSSAENCFRFGFIGGKSKHDLNRINEGNKAENNSKFNH